MENDRIYKKMPPLRPKINLYSRPGAEDFALIGLCKAAIDADVYSATVPTERLDEAWKWLEKSPVIPVARLDYTAELPLENLVFKKIKDAFKKGAAEVELAVPTSLWRSMDAAEALVDIALEAADGKPLKIDLETPALSVPALREAARLLLAAGVPVIKTASGLYPRASTLAHLNVLFEEIRGAGNESVRVDFLFEPADRFVASDAARLALSMLGAADRLVMSVEWR